MQTTSIFRLFSHSREQSMYFPVFQCVVSKLKTCLRSNGLIFTCMHENSNWLHFLSEKNITVGNSEKENSIFNNYLSSTYFNYSSKELFLCFTKYKATFHMMNAMYVTVLCSFKWYCTGCTLNYISRSMFHLFMALSCICF